MGKAKGKFKSAAERRLSAPPTRTLPALTSTTQVIDFQNLSGFDSANQSQNRARINWWELDTTKELREYDRLTIVRKSRALYWNTGLGKSAIKKPCNFIGVVKPNPASSSPEWNAWIEKRFWEHGARPAAFDRAGKCDFFSWQSTFINREFRDGDFLTAFTRTPYDRATRVALYETHQLRKNDQEKNIFAGVEVDPRSNRRIAFWVYDPVADKDVRLPAEQCIFHVDDIEVSARARGIPILNAAINHLQDIAETNLAIKVGIKIAQKNVAYRTRKQPAKSNMTTGFAGNSYDRAVSGGATGIPRPIPLPGGHTPAPVATEPVPVQSTIRVEDVFADGAVFDNVPTDEEIKLLHDSRPHPNTTDFLDRLVEETAAAVGMPVRVFWRVLTGSADTRFTLIELKNFLEAHRPRRNGACDRWWLQFTSDEIAAGREGMPEPPDDYYAVEWIDRADDTIDASKMGKLEMERIAFGLGTYKSAYAKAGEGWQEQFNQRIAEEKWLQSRCDAEKVPYERIIQPRQGTAYAQPPEPEKAPV